MSSLLPAPAPLQRAFGAGRIAAAHGARGAVLQRLYQEGCAKIRLPNTHDASLQAVLINTAGGLTGGDRLNWAAEAGPGARLVLTTQACERAYRSLGDAATVEIRLSAAPGAHIDWLPQETILFEGSRLHRTLEVDLAPGARLCAVEAVLLGREAMGERAPSAMLRDDWRIRLEGKLIHAEATRLEGQALERTSLSLLSGNTAFATILYVGPDTERRLGAVRGVLPAGAGASLMGERLVVRVVAQSGLALRRIVAPILPLLTASGSLPRLWHI